jgi:intron-binding protein aquarius
MAPRTRNKEEPRREADDGRPAVADLEGENSFAKLAKQTWLKTSKKTTKVKIKPDVLKTEIWDVLEKEDFAFKSLLVLENLQILEKYRLLLLFSWILLIGKTGICGQDILRTRPTSTSCSLS